MRSFTVTARDLSSVEVQGTNWLVALGAGLHELNRMVDITRLACEVLPNGTVIARDITSGHGYIVQDLGGEEERVPEDTKTTEAPEEELTFGEPTEHEEEDEDWLELPADAIDDLDPDEAQLMAIDAAETPLMACMLALEAARERVPAESGAVILEEGGYLRFAAVRGPHSRKLVGVRLPLGTGVAGFAMEKRRTVVLADAHEDPRHCGEVDALTGYVTREIAVVPFTGDDQVLGVLELMNLKGKRRFTERDVEEIQEVADALARRLTD